MLRDLSQNGPGDEGDANRQPRRSLFLVFVAGGRRMAIDVSHLKEVASLSKLTTLPRSPRYARGMMDLHGQLVPILDLRLRFDWPGGRDETDFVIVFRHQNTCVGLLVDDVEEIVGIPRGSIEVKSTEGHERIAGYISGVIKSAAGATIPMLDAARLISSN